MSERLEQCCIHLRQEVHSVETKLTDVTRHLSRAAETGVETFDHRMKEVRQQQDVGREQADQAGSRLRQWLEEAKADAVSRIEDWRTDREISKLEEDADEKEERAADAILAAAYALLEAEATILDALKARKIAVEVAG